MGWGYSYSLLEGLKGLRRAKFSAFVSISTIFLSLALMGVFIIFIFNIQRLISQIQARMELELFIDNSYDQAQIDELQQKIMCLEGVESIRYVSKAEAADIFKQQFGQDIFSILDDNPLPPSLQIKLKPKFQSAAPAKKISEKLSQLEGVDEVIYRHDMLVLLEKYIRIFVVVILGSGLLLASGSIFLVSNTIKLIIFSRYTIIEIMKLVGATRRFIRRPFLVEGLVQGLIGGILAAIVFYIIFSLIKLEIPGLILVDQLNYLILVVAGILFGWIGSLLALRRFLKY